jgi:hypothetical protein
VSKCSFINGQVSHVVATKEKDLCTITTGAEKIISTLCHYPFSEVAKDDGEIIEVDDELKVFKIRYKDGTEKTFKYGLVPTKNGGVYISQNIKCNVIKGQKIKKGDFLLYNEDYFIMTPDGIPTYSTGVNMYVAYVENSETMEDSAAFYKESAKKLGFNPIRRVTAVLHKDCNIYDNVDLNNFVYNTDTLLSYDDGDIPETFLKNIENLQDILDINKNKLIAEYTGKLVEIDIKYNCPLNEMSSSLQAYIKKYNTNKYKIAKIANNESDFPKPKELIGERKIGKAIVDENSIVIDFYIQQDTSLETGDKTIFSSSLKSIPSKIIHMPFYAVDIKDKNNNQLLLDAKFSASSDSNRIVLDNRIVGIGQRYIDKLKENIIDIYFNS